MDFRSVGVYLGQVLVGLVKNALGNRYVLGNFIARDLKIKYRGTVFGYLWSLLEPLSLVGVYYFIFVVIAKRGEGDYALVVALGILPWTYFSSVILGGANALRANAGLVRKVQLPREIYVLAQAATALVVLLLSMLVTIPFLLYYDMAPGPRLLLWPLAIVIMTMIAVGVGLIASCANVIYRDVSYVLTVLLRLGLYFSGVIFPVSMVPERIRYLFCFNPIALCIAMARNALLNRPMPFEPVHVLSAALVALLSMIVGTALFYRWEKRAVRFL